MIPPPHDYQLTAEQFMLDRLYVKGEKGVGLFLDPGLGKTRITLNTLSFLHDAGEFKRALIVAPLRVCNLVWPEEIEKWKIPLTCSTRGSSSASRCTLNLINPESIHKIEPGQHDLLVVDESTRFKTWTTKRMKALRKLLPHLQKRIILTGTPAANSLADLHAQLFILDDGESLGRNVTVFRSRFMERGGWQGRQWLFREEMAQEIYDRIAPLVLRMDAETYLDMPQLVTNDVWCELPQAAKREYKRLKEELLAQLESADILALNAASAYTKMKQLTGGAVYDSERTVHDAHSAKLEALDDLIDELGGKPLLTFFQFRHEAERIVERHKDAVILWGGTKVNEAATIVQQWNAGEIRNLLIQPQSASHGLNLQYGPCADVAWYGLGDSAEVYDQAVRRVYRQGQQAKQIRVHRLLCRQTVDDIISNRLAGKFKTQESFFNALKKHARS